MSAHNGNAHNGNTHGTRANASIASASEVRAFWDDLYSERPQIWTGNANAVLADTVESLEPGTALDLGSGEGGDSVWMAERGWRVTGVDISATAIARARALAAERHIPSDRIDWLERDLATWVPDAAYDLVSACFLQSPIDFPRAAVLRVAAAAVAPGGQLLVVSHAGPPPWSTGGHQHGGHLFPAADEQLASLELADGEWEVLSAEVRARPVVAPSGEHTHIEDTVLRVRRRHPAGLSPK